jgi:malic enzyme
VPTPTAGEIVPSVFDASVVPAVAAAVARAARRDGVVRD